MSTVQIQVRSLPGGWRISVGDTETRPAETDVSSHRLASAAERIAMLLAPQPFALGDAQRSESEETAGTLLAEILGDSRTLAALHERLGEAKGRGERALLLIDAPETDVRGLPWELFGDPVPLETRGIATVARLCEGTPAPPFESSRLLDVALIALDPSDPVCTGRVERVRELLERFGAKIVPADAHPSVVHIVAHGTVEQAYGQVFSEDAALGAASAAHRLSGLLPCPLVVLDICDAGSVTTSESSALGPRLIAAGAQAVLAPSTRWSVEAADAFGHGLYSELVRGRAVSDAVANGRREVRALGRPHPDSRWCTPVLHVASAASAHVCLVQPTWLPTGWSTPAPEVAQLLGDARTLAAPHGFVGIEHLLAAWPESGGGPWAAHIRYLLAHRTDPRQRLGGLRPKTSRSADFGGTPRLRALGDCADLESLARGLWTGSDALPAFFGVRIVFSDDMSVSGATLDPMQSDADTWEMATVLEVLGGPEDGRVFEPGSVIGRARSTEGGLYGHSYLIDPYLSRQALVWTDQGMELRKTARRRQSEHWEPIEPGPITLFVGEVLALTPSTVVFAR